MQEVIFVTSEALKTDVKGNMHMCSKVIKVSDFESEVNLRLFGNSQGL